MSSAASILLFFAEWGKSVDSVRGSAAFTAFLLGLTRILKRIPFAAKSR